MSKSNFHFIAKVSVIKKYLPTLSLILLIAIIFACTKKDLPPSNPPVVVPPVVVPPVGGGTKAISISSFSPKSGYAKDTVTILGNNFGTDTSIIWVNFNGYKVHPKEISATKLKALIPQQAITGKLSIYLKDTLKATSDSIFTKLEKGPDATITSFSPQTGRAGETVIISGTNFGTDTNAVTIKFSESLPVKPKTISANSMSVVLPATAKTGKIELTILGKNTVVTTGIFTVKGPLPIITSFTPNTAVYGDTIKIIGKNFETITNTRVIINGVSLIPITISPTEIIVKLPNFIFKGKISVSVTNNGEGVSNQELLIQQPTSVGPFQPASARPGEIIEVNCAFPSSEFSTLTIRFQGSSVEVKPILTAKQRNNYFLVRIPLDAKSGKFSVTQMGWGPGVSQSSLTILPKLPPVEPGKWTNSADFVTSGREGAISFVVAGKAYVGLGTTKAPFDDYASSDLWQFEPQYNSWMQVADIEQGGLVYASAFAINNYGYVGTGQDNNGTHTQRFMQYDASGNKWARKADYKGASRSTAVGFTVGNKGYIGTGKSSFINYNDFYQYDPGNDSWKQIASIKTARGTAFSLVINDKAYVGGGDKISEFHMYDSSSDTWIAKSNVPTNYSGSMSSFSIKGKGYAGLGYGYSPGTNVKTGSKVVFEYNPSSDQWNSISEFKGTSRSYAIGFSIDNVGYFGLGSDDGNLRVFKDFWAFTL